MAEDSARWGARLDAGPLDGAHLGIDVDPDELPDGVVVTFVVGGGAPVLHTYVLDPSRSRFRYLGEDGDPRASAPVGATRVHIDGGDGRLTLTERFYELLFERHPGVRAMFPTSPVDMTRQTRMLQAAIDAVVAHLDDEPWLRATLGRLGSRHARWGVTEEMYAAFTECMLEAMRELAGPDWTPDMRRAWSDLLEDIRDLMVAGSD